MQHLAQLLLLWLPFLQLLKLPAADRQLLLCWLLLSTRRQRQRLPPLLLG
jgi:hypothetical protein